MILPWPSSSIVRRLGQGHLIWGMSGGHSLRKGNPVLQGARGKPLFQGLDRYSLVAALVLITLALACTAEEEAKQVTPAAAASPSPLPFQPLPLDLPRQPQRLPLPWMSWPSRRV